MTALNPPSWFTSRRVGRFEINSSVIEHQPSAARLVLGSCVVVRAEMMPLDFVDYVAICDQFAEIGPAGEIPRYRAEIIEGAVVWSPE